MRHSTRVLRATAIGMGIALFLIFQVAVIVRSHFVESKHFAFWMFPESTFFVAELSLESRRGREIPTDQGAWAIRGKNGPLHFSWGSYVNDYRLDALNTRVRSKGTWADTQRYFQEALDYVATRIDEDYLTNRLILRLRVEKAGEPPQTIVLKSRPRFPKGQVL